MPACETERHFGSPNEVVGIQGRNESPVCEIVRQEREVSVSFAVAPRTAEVPREKASHLWVEDVKRARVPSDDSVLGRKSLSLWEDFSKGSPEMSEAESFTASEGWLYRFRTSFGLKNRKITGDRGRVYIH